jgi:hypothetical protein
MTSPREALRRILVTKAQELFSDYGVTCEAVGSVVESTREMCGILGFASTHLSGAVVVCATPDAIASSNPLGDGATRGWVAELTNQLVGRFKNELLRTGVELVMSIPVVLTGGQVAPLHQVVSQPTRLAVGSGFLTLWLEVEIDPDLVIADPVADLAAPESHAPPTHAPVRS